MKYLVIIALSAMVWLFFQQSHNTTHEKMQTVSQEYMKDLVITNYTESGSPAQIVKASKWNFVPDEGKSYIINPHLIVNKENGDSWVISANKAFAWQESLESKIDKVDLIYNVVIERAANKDFTATVLNTESMQYFPQEEKVTSDVKVSMRQPGLLINGYGLIGYLEKDWIKLLDKTTTVYDEHLIKSRQAEFDNKKGTALYTDHVTVDKENTHLTSDTLYVYSDDNMLAEGMPATLMINGDMITSPTFKYNAKTEQLFTKNSTVVLKTSEAQ